MLFCGYRARTLNGLQAMREAICLLKVLNGIAPMKHNGKLLTLYQQTFLVGLNWGFFLIINFGQWLFLCITKPGRK